MPAELYRFIEINTVLDPVSGSCSVEFFQTKIIFCEPIAFTIADSRKGLDFEAQHLCQRLHMERIRKGQRDGFQRLQPAAAAYRRDLYRRNHHGGKHRRSRPDGDLIYSKGRPGNRREEAESAGIEPLEFTGVSRGNAEKISRIVERPGFVRADVAVVKDSDGIVSSQEFFGLKSYTFIVPAGECKGGGCQE